MTTAFDTLDDGLTGAQNGKLPWWQVAGFISPNKAMDPGLAYDMGKADFVKYQCLRQKALVAASDCTTYGTMDATYNLNLPSQQTASTASGSRLFTVQTSYVGKMGVVKAGLNDVTLGAPVTLTPDVNADILAVRQAGVDTSSVAVYPMTIPTGTLAARFALHQVDVSDAADDNDLLVLYPDGTTYGASGTNTSNEALQIALPPAGNYKVCVQAYAGKATMTHQLSSWIVEPGDTGGKFNVALPANVHASSMATVRVSWSGLTAGERYRGAAAFTDGSGAYTVFNDDRAGGTQWRPASLGNGEQQAKANQHQALNKIGRPLRPRVGRAPPSQAAVREGCGFFRPGSAGGEGSVRATRAARLSVAQLTGLDAVARARPADRARVGHHRAVRAQALLLIGRALGFCLLLDEAAKRLLVGAERGPGPVARRSAAGLGTDADAAALRLLLAARLADQRVDGGRHGRCAGRQYQRQRAQREGSNPHGALHGS